MQNTCCGNKRILEIYILNLSMHKPRMEYVQPTHLESKIAVSQQPISTKNFSSFITVCVSHNGMSKCSWQSIETTNTCFSLSSFKDKL